MQVLDKELIATVFVEAIYTSDEQACKKYGISRRTLQRWRQEQANDPIVAQYVATKKKAFDNAWANELKVTLYKGVSLLADCFDAVRSDPMYKKNPEIIHKVAGAIILCADVELTGKMIDARIRAEDNPQDSLPRQDDSAEAKPVIN